MFIAICVILGILIVLGLYILATYNGLVKTNERVDEAWSDITVQLKYRADLIPNLVETVKGYAKHEDDIFKSVSDARSKMMGAKGVKTTAEADEAMSGALSRLLAISEAYPELKANENFKELQQQLADTEDKIQAARRFYNAGAKELNSKIKMFPANILFHSFKTREYYEVAEAEKAKIDKAPEVKF